MVTNAANGHPPELRHISLSYTSADSDNSALRLVYTIEPKWREEKHLVHITKFTDGITNTVRSERLRLPGADLADDAPSSSKLSRKPLASRTSR